MSNVRLINDYGSSRPLTVSRDVWDALGRAVTGGGFVDAVAAGEVRGVAEQLRKVAPRVPGGRAVAEWFAGLTAGRVVVERERVQPPPRKATFARLRSYGATGAVAPTVEVSARFADELGVAMVTDGGGGWGMGGGVGFRLEGEGDRKRAISLLIKRQGPLAHPEFDADATAMRAFLEGGVGRIERVA